MRRHVIRLLAVFVTPVCINRRPPLADQRNRVNNCLAAAFAHRL